MKRMLVLAALTAFAALASGCWNGVDVVTDGCTAHHIIVGDMKCASCEYEITPSNAVINVVFIKDTNR